MKPYRFIIAAVTGLLFFSLGASAQEGETISFSYDEGGNLIERKVQVFPAGRFSNIFQPTDSIVPNRVEFKIFPNPSNEFLNIEGELPENIQEAKINISNINGQVLKTDVYNGTSKKINVTDLKKGMYLLEVVYSKKEKSTYKIIIN